jgi:hypothetical protein
MLRPLVVSLLLAACIGCAPVESGVAMPMTGSQTYQSYDTHFTLTYPVGWRDLPRISLPEDTTFAAVSDDALELLVVTRDYPTPPTLEAVLDETRRQLGDRLRDAAIVPLNGHQAVRVVADGTADGRPVRLLQYMVLSQDRLYNLTLRSPPEAFGPRQGQLEAIAASFKLN